MIQAIIFDIGGVLVSTTFSAYLAKIAQEHSFDLAALKDFTIPLFHRVMIGELTETEMFKLVAKEFQIPSDATALRAGLINSIYRLEEVWEIVRKLHGKYRLAILSNLGHETIQRFEPELELLTYFDPIVYSAPAGFAKPDPQIYHHILKLLDLPAEECIFIDDKEKNTTAAEAIGIHGIVFTDADKLKQDLKSLGININ